jgi:hypothetical protein
MFRKLFSSEISRLPSFLITILSAIVVKTGFMSDVFKSPAFCHSVISISPKLNGFLTLQVIAINIKSLCR